MNKSFTLVELLIVIGILAVLSAAIVVVLNPAELLKQARDSKRLQDLTSIDQSLSVSQAIYADIDLGTASTVYVSIADTSATCANLGLPSLPSGWAYNCVTSANLINTDGTGWVPVNFQDTNLVGAVQLTSLPLDPTNTTSTGLYYTYTPGGSWELNTLIESDKYRATTDNDGGDSYAIYEKGSTLTLLPYSDSGLVGYWTFEEGSGSTTQDVSGNGNTGTLTNSPTWTTGKVGNYALDFDGTSYVLIPYSGSLDLNTNFSISLWMAPSNLTTNQRYAGIYGGYDTLTYTLYFHEDNDNNLAFRAKQSSVTKNLIFSPSFFSSVGEWTYLTLVREASTGTYLYKNGVLKTQNLTVTGVIDAYVDSKAIGKDYSNNYEGEVDSVRVYNRALSASEVQAIYNATK